MTRDTSSQPAQPATSPSDSHNPTPTHRPDPARAGEVWLPPGVFVRIAPDLEVMQVTAGNVLLALRRVGPPDGNTMPIVSTAHAELDEDHGPAYRDEPSLARGQDDESDLCADPVCIVLGHGAGPDGCPR